MSAIIVLCEITPVEIQALRITFTEDFVFRCPQLTHSFQWRRNELERAVQVQLVVLVALVMVSTVLSVQFLLAVLLIIVPPVPSHL